MMSQEPVLVHRLEGQPYVFDVCASCEVTQPHVAVSLSDSTCRVFALTEAALLETLSFAPHTKLVTSIHFSSTDPHTLYTSSVDKSVAVFDTRDVSAAVARFRFPDEVLACASSINDKLLAVASGSSVYFSDMRKNDTSLGSYSDCHTDVITSVMFNPSRPSVLASGGEDGLVCVFDTSVPSDKEAVVSILNTDCPLRRFGFFGADAQGVFCLSSTETASCWHYTSAQRLGSFASVRTDLGVDYLVDCLYDSRSDALTVLGGRFSGEGQLGLVTPTSIAARGSLVSGHEDIIRTSVTLPCGEANLLTGGEDGALCLWNLRLDDTPTELAQKKRKIES